MDADQLPYPSDQDLLEFFWCEPLKIEDVVVYSVTDERGVGVRFSYNLAEGSIQTAISLGGESLDTVSSEMLTGFRLYGRTLIAHCRYADGNVTMELTVRPTISVRWFGLQTQ
jgi:hypothetical protein